jgi:uncharacterized membrane protein YgaE (UPF0421/DUF939 family)
LSVRSSSPPGTSPPLRERLGRRRTGARTIRHDWVTAPRRRAREALRPAAHAALGAAAAWLIAHVLLGHADPFFAPVAAAIALGTNYSQRSLRIVQMVLGVLLGIGVGSVLGGLLGASTPALGLIVFVTLVGARALGAGFMGSGMMFANQAASSAILVTVLHHGGTGAERALDAAVGGAVALLIGVVLFPSHPLPRLRVAERAVLASLAGALGAAVALLRTGAPAQPAWTLAATQELHERLAQLAEARSAARTNVRVAPRRWSLRATVDAEDQRLARLNLLADAALSVVRSASAALEDRRPLPDALERQIAAIATAVGRLASTPQPWPPDLLAGVGQVAERATEERAGEQVDWASVVASSLRTAARDLEAVIGSER